MLLRDLYNRFVPIAKQKLQQAENYLQPQNVIQRNVNVAQNIARPIQQIPQQVNRVVRPIVQNQVSNPSSFLSRTISGGLGSGSATRAGDLNTPQNTSPVLKWGDTYMQNQVKNPLSQGYQMVKQPGTLNKVLGGLSMVGGAINATPAGLGFNTAFGAAATASRDIREGRPLTISNIKNSAATIADKTTSPVSLGTDVLGIKNQKVSQAVDIGSMIALMAGGHLVGKANAAKDFTNIVKSSDIGSVSNSLDKVLKPTGVMLSDAEHNQAAQDLAQIGTKKGVVDYIKNLVTDKAGSTNTIPNAVDWSANKGINPPLTTEKAISGVEPLVGQGGKGVVEPIVGDVKKIIQGTNTKERGFITSIKTSEKTPQVLKDMVSGSYVPKTTAELKSAAKKLIQTDINAAEQVAINPTSDVHIQIGHELINHYAQTGQLDKAKALAESMANSGTEFGRAVQAFANYDKTTPSGAIKFAQTTINKYNRENPTSKLKLTDEMVTGLFDKAKQIQNMAEGRERNIASQQLINQVNDLIPSSVADKAVTVWKAGLLTSFRTTERNLLGNTIHGIAEVAKDIPASIADMVMNLRTGKRTLTATVKGIGGGIKKGWGRASDIMTLGFDPEKTIEKFDVKRVSWGNNPVEQGLKKYTDFVYNWMGAQDKLFYHSAFARSLYDQAGAEAINVGKRGDSKFIQSLVDNATEVMKQNATKDATTAVFQDKNVLSKMINGLKQKAGGARWATEVVAPFTGVPSSIAGQMVAYSPIGLTKGLWDTAKVLVGKTPEIQRQAAQEVGRGVIGTGIAGIAAVLASKGLITGNPKDAAEARQWELEGKQANSVFVAGKWRSINSVGPEALIALAGAKVQQSKSLAEAAGNIGKDFMSQTFLAGVQQPLNAISDPARYAGSYFKSQVGSLIPNAIKDVSKALDPLQRETNSAVDMMKSGIPLLRNTLLPKRDALGTPLPNEVSGYKAFVDLFNSKTPVKNPVVNELSRLNLVGENTTPSKLTADQTVYGQKVKLTPQELDTLEQQSGGQVSKVLDTIVSSPSYKSLADSDKKDMISNAVSDVRTSVKEGAVSGMGVDTNSITGKYKSQLEMDQFDKSGKKSAWINDTYYFRKANGQPDSLTKDEYTTKLNTQKMDLAYNNDDYKGWLSLANEKLASIENQYNNADPLTQSSLQNDYIDLIQKIQKYQSYGGFKKSSAAKAKISLGKITKPAKFSMKVSKPKKITIKKLKIKKPSQKA